ncbi:MAG: hypothetical protein IJV15_00145 [Lachnospiraceae bacterium]|nr:hypothetical protein [Lachnospiraceae bacterium]
MNNIKYEENEKEYIIKVPKEVNHTIEELKQRLINYLFEDRTYNNTDVEIMKLLLDSNNIHSELVANNDGITISASKIKLTGE